MRKLGFEDEFWAGELGWNAILTILLLSFLSSSSPTT
jgi:hypothetical protein